MRSTETRRQAATEPASSHARGRATVQALSRRFRSDPAFRQAVAALEKEGASVHSEGLTTSARPLFVSALHEATERPLLVLCPTEEVADRLHQTLAACLPPERVRFFPSMEMTLFERYGVDAEAQADRLRVLAELSAGRAGVIIASGTTLLHDIVPRNRFAGWSRVLATGEETDREDLVDWLVGAGYRRVEMVTEPGECALRGFIIDIFPPTHTQPVRVELFGDEIESIRSFDPSSQRSTGPVASLRLVPATELLCTSEEMAAAADRIEALVEEQLPHLEPEARDRLRGAISEDLELMRSGAKTQDLTYYSQLLYRGGDTLLDYLPTSALLVCIDPHRMVRAAEELLEDLEEAHGSRLERGELPALPEPTFRQVDELTQLVASRQGVYVTLLAPSLEWAGDRTLVEHKCHPVDSMRGSVVELSDQVSEWQLEGNAVVLSTTQRKRLLNILSERDVEHVEEYSETADVASGMVHVGTLAVEGGFRMPEARLVVVTDREMFGYHRPVLPARRPRAEVKLTSLAELKEGDFVVHVSHGVGRYVGIVQDTVEGVERDYLEVEYDGGKLKVPTTQIDRIQKYIGAEGVAPKLDSLSGTTWSRKRKRAEKATKQLALELLKLYAEREAAVGHRFSEDQPWQHEMEGAFIYDETTDQLEATFPYEETPEQMRAIDEVMADLEADKVMDRLVCGDVGFGKTEVAVRAAFKAVLDGKQVAVLVPTTILCEQHSRTFEERLGAYPVRVDKLSRFTPAKEEKGVIQGVTSGATDIVIGTHKLLSEKVKFSDLGLLIVDEEQRFGVKHKERLRQTRANVDLLTLTATPIPRTLHMALSGIRDLSTINQAPRGRVAIRTFCVEEEDEVIREAIRREINREGQVYFVHNRVRTIAGWARRLKKLVPDARIAVAHGQMTDEELESIMLDFYAGDYDVLCCTSIIESGLDVPNVNTLIVQNAPGFGLAQLYQLRGRVGRSSRQAYAYFLYSDPARLTAEGEERLAAIREFTELGSGFRIAMRDLEIRGAGSLLGAEQHGHIEAIGFELYCQMLRDAVEEIRGERPEVPEELPSVDLPLDAFLPASYVPSDGHRLDLYRRLSTIRDMERLADLKQELEDRFGPMPEEAANLVRVLRFRVLCGERDVVASPAEAGSYQLRIRPGLQITKGAQAKLKKYWMLHARRTLRALEVKDLWVTVTFANIPASEKLQALEEVAELIATEPRPVRSGR
ncbi:MAG: DEAD/DEAH box helicase [Armatimonadia bacterium]|nr:DEAD/DEAH box helicase [Armatimonadia bacterium]